MTNTPKAAAVTVKVPGEVYDGEGGTFAKGAKVEGLGAATIKSLRAKGLVD